MTSSIEVTKKEMMEMKPYDFERFVASIWESKGFDTTVRQESRDFGIDIIAIQQEKKTAIQVKRYSQSNKVGSQDVRNYATLYQQDESIDSVMIVSSGGFTKPSKKLSDKLNIELINGDDIAKMAEKQNISVTDFISPELEELTEAERLVMEQYDMGALEVRNLSKEKLKKLESEAKEAIKMLGNMRKEKQKRKRELEKSKRKMKEATKKVKDIRRDKKDR